jgi:hypothetical protein
VHSSPEMAVRILQALGQAGLVTATMTEGETKHV